MTTDQPPASAGEETEKPDPYASGDIVARPGRYYRNARFLMAVLLLGMAGWFAYDGWVNWPAENAKVASPLSSTDCGPEVMVVAGACVSTVNVRVAGDGSVLPAASLARTLNVWLPSASAFSVLGLVQETHEPESTLQP